jgi:hypothetical protein
MTAPLPLRHRRGMRSSWHPSNVCSTASALLSKLLTVAVRALPKCKPCFFVALPSDIATVPLSFLDVRSHARIASSCKHLNAVSRLSHSWPLILRVLGLMYGMHVEQTCDWPAAERLLVAAPQTIVVQALTGLLLMERVAWRRANGFVLYDRALGLLDKAAKAKYPLAQVWFHYSHWLNAAKPDSGMWLDKLVLDYEALGHAEASDDALRLLWKWLIATTICSIAYRRFRTSQGAVRQRPGALAQPASAPLRVPSWPCVGF